MMRTSTRDGWCVSATTGTDIAGAILSVFRVRSENPYKVQRADCDGRNFASSEDAFRFALERGYLQHYVTPWCREHRTLHTFLGKRSAWCADGGHFTF